MIRHIFLSGSTISATIRRLSVPVIKFSKEQPPKVLCSASLKKAMAADDLQTALYLIEEVIVDKDIILTNEQILSAFEACEKTRQGDLIVRLLERTNLDNIKHRKYRKKSL